MSTQSVAAVVTVSIRQCFSVPTNSSIRCTRAIPLYATAAWTWRRYRSTRAAAFACADSYSTKASGRRGCSACQTRTGMGQLCARRFTAMNLRTSYTT